MQMTDATAHANQLVTAWILRQYRKDGGNEHLRSCEAATVGPVDGGDGGYGCDTGCDYVRLEADIACPHGQTDRFEYGTFGELAWILEDLEADREP